MKKFDVAFPIRTVTTSPPMTFDQFKVATENAMTMIGAPIPPDADAGSRRVATAYKYICSDAGRSTSKRPKQKRDCAVRAIAIVMSKKYDDVYDELARCGRRSGRSTPHDLWKLCLADLDGIKFSFPAVKGRPRMNLSAFCEQHRTGRFVVQMAGHLTAVVDGVVYDYFAPRADGCVYTVWEIR